MPKLREYGKAVFAATDAYVDGLSETIWQRRSISWAAVPFRAFFLGMMSADSPTTPARFPPSRAQGLKGYPF